MNDNKTCEHKYKIGCTTYCEIFHDGYTTCTSPVHKCKDSKLVEPKQIKKKFYSFKEKKLNHGTNIKTTD